jgi:hypothetical protein
MTNMATVETSTAGATAPCAARHRGAGETVVIIGNGMALCFVHDGQVGTLPDFMSLKLEA